MYTFRDSIRAKLQFCRIPIFQSSGGGVFFLKKKKSKSPWREDYEEGFSCWGKFYHLSFYAISLIQITPHRTLPLLLSAKVGEEVRQNMVLPSP